MRVAAGQTLSRPGNIHDNVGQHLALGRRAAERGVELLVFPELSLTGYEPDLVAACELRPDDARLAPLRTLAARAGMTILVGAPVASEDGQALSIGCIALFADRTATIYRKHFLHQGEERFVVAGASISRIHRIADTSVALAICADAAHEEHVVAARRGQANVYAAGVFWGPSGYADDAALMQRYASVHRLLVVVANHGGPSGGMPSAGRSAIWAPGGELLACAHEHGQGLVIASPNNGGWCVESIAVATCS